MSASKQHLRGFRLVIDSKDTDTYGVRLEETNGHPDNSVTVAAIKAEGVAPFLGAMRAALVESGHKPTVIGPARRKPIVLDEASGVRLALAIRAGAPLAKSVRRSSVIEGVSSMSDEEAYYWYAKISRVQTGKRALRALRILLSDDGRTGVSA